MTGDDHANGGTAGRFDAVHRRAARPAARSPNWECVRGTSYIYPGTPLTDAQAAGYDAQGFEVGAARQHRLRRLDAGVARRTSTRPSSRSSTRAATRACRRPSTNRTHCIAWSDWATQPKVELAHGIRLDTNYYYWPPSWVQDRPGLLHRLRHADALRRHSTAR